MISSTEILIEIMGCKMKNYRTTQHYQRTSGDILGAIHISFGVIMLGLYAIMNSTACNYDPKEKAYDTVTLKSYPMTYNIAFVCTRGQIRDDSCRNVENLESVFVNKEDEWSKSYSREPREKWEQILTPQLQESAWHMVEGEYYLRINAEREQK